MGEADDYQKRQVTDDSYYYKIGLWVLIVALIGFLGGTYYTKRWVIIPKLVEAMKMGALVIDGTVYDLKERIGK